MKTILILVIVACLSGLDRVVAQSVEAENEIKLSRSARKGFLASYSQDDATGDITLVYVTKEKRKKVEYEVYVIDGETYKQKSHEEFSKGVEEFRSEFDDFQVIEETYSEPGIAIKGSLPQDGVYSQGVGGAAAAVADMYKGAFGAVFKGLELQKYRLDYEYDWSEGRYYYSVKELDDVNPRVGDDLKLDSFDSFTIKQNGEYHLVVLAGERSPAGFKAAREGTIDPDQNKKKMHIMKFSPDGQKTNDVDLQYSNPYTFRHGNFIDNNERYAMVLTGPEPSVKGVDAEAELVIVDMDGNIDERLQFQAKQARWHIFNIFQSGDNYYIYGGAENEKAGNTDSFQLARVNKNGTSKVTLTDNETILNSAQGDPGTPYGETTGFLSSWKVKYHPMVQHVMESGDFVLGGQVAKYKDDKKKIEDLYLLHFNAQGDFVTQYAFEPEENNALTDQDLFETADGQLSWIVYAAGQVNEYTVDRYPRIAKIDLASKKISAFKDIGDGDYYISSNNGAVYDLANGKAHYFGHDKRGKEIWFARVEL